MTSPFIRAIPKTDLHVHLIGVVRPQTLNELAQKHSVPLMDAYELYSRVNSDPTETEAGNGPWYPLLRIQEWICECLRDEEDFERVVFEALEDGATSSNVIYQEIAFNPSIHLSRGISLRTALNGLGRGIQAARDQLGVDARLIAAIDRGDTPTVATAMVREVLDARTDDLVGIGMDCYEGDGAPETFVEAYNLAEAGGLHRTSHASEHVAAAENTAIALDLLHCERIDHGYYVLENPDIVARCRDERIAFNVAFTTSRRAYRPWRRDRIKRMLAEDLWITINSDDPALFPTTVANEFQIAHDDLGLSHERLAQIAVGSVGATFLDEPDKQRLIKAMRGGADEAFRQDHQDAREVITSKAPL